MKQNRPPRHIGELFDYYLKHGFNEKPEDIAYALGISKKTFYNRYRSKDEAVKAAVGHWHQLVRQRFDSRNAACNHDVESLALFIGELKWIRANETPFYEYTVENGGFHAPGTPFPEVLQNILKRGIQHYQFKKDIRPEIYSRFLLVGLTASVQFPAHEDIFVQYLLAPLLSERGREALGDMDLGRLLL